MGGSRGIGGLEIGVRRIGVMGLIGLMEWDG